MSKVKFQTISIKTFHHKHSDAAEALEEEDIEMTLPRTYGEVKIPGHGWRPCVLNSVGVPSHFYDEDDGWQECPPVTFEKCKSSLIQSILRS